jgi:hypothetical protein
MTYLEIETKYFRNTISSRGWGILSRNFVQEFCPEGVAFEIFYEKMSNPHPLPDPHPRVPDPPTH